MKNKSINEITLFRYLFNLDNRDLPQSILNWYYKMQLENFLALKGIVVN